MDISTSAQVCTEIRRALSNFVEDNADQFVVGGSNVIFLDSQDPLKMTMGVVYTFPHNGELACQDPKGLGLVVARHRVCMHTYYGEGFTFGQNGYAVMVRSLSSTLVAHGKRSCMLGGGCEAQHQRC